VFVDERSERFDRYRVGGRGKATEITLSERRSYEMPLARGKMGEFIILSILNKVNETRAED
jgi:hypothetical protein